MSPAIPSCVLCGWVVADRPGVVSWVNQFRALIPDLDDGFLLTGVGLHDDPFSPTPLAPRRAHDRWDLPGFQNRDPALAAQSNQIILALKHHIVFHDACYQLLDILMGLDQHLLVRIAHICSSLPVPTRGTSMSWGHDYGGLVRVETDDAYPWEERFSDRPTHEVDPVFLTDPLSGVRATELLRGEPSLPPQPQTPSMTTLVSTSSPLSRDPLDLLPLEIRTMMADELTVADYLNVRLASRAMWPVYHHQQWWRRKFYTTYTRGGRDANSNDEDRSWLFEAWDEDEIDAARDWRWLYHATRQCMLAPSLRNRKRIWRMLQAMVPIVGLDMSLELDPRVRSPPRPRPLRPRPRPRHPRQGLPPLMPTASLRATVMPTMMVAMVPSSEFLAAMYAEPCVAARVRQATSYGGIGLGVEPSDGFHAEGCRPRHYQAIPVTNHDASVTVYTVRLGDASYICGIEIVSAQGRPCRAGYKSLHSTSAALEGRLRGFVAAVGSRGVHAVQFYTESHVSHPGPLTPTIWLGDTTADCPKTGRLYANQGGVGRIEALVDGCKIVCLTVRPRNGSPAAPPQRRRLRDSAFWYPEIPEPRLRLHDNVGLRQDRFLRDYHPIFWTHFGGPAGCRLGHLTGVGVLLRVGREGIARIDFYFADASGIDGSQYTLGRCCRGTPDRSSDSTTMLMRFDIDGPGGERIQAVDVLHRVSTTTTAVTGANGQQTAVLMAAGPRQGLGPGRADFLTLRITTNWGRWRLFAGEAGPCCDLAPSEEVRMWRVAGDLGPGEAITGFYAEQRPELGFGLALVGVISEQVPVGVSGPDDGKSGPDNRESGPDERESGQDSRGDKEVAV